MTLKEELDKIWEEPRCHVPLELCQWRWFGVIHETLVHQLYEELKDEED